MGQKSLAFLSSLVIITAKGSFHKIFASAQSQSFFFDKFNALSLRETEAHIDGRRGRGNGGEERGRKEGERKEKKTLKRKKEKRVKD